jgi:hypothetical protein
MPHYSLKLIPGVDVNRTPALNEAAISSSNLIRFVPDRQGIGLVQKLGGWTRYYQNSIESIIRCLWAWEDTNANAYLAAGAEQSLSVITGLTEPRNRRIITPRRRTDNVAVSIDTTSGSNSVIISDTGSNITDYDFVFISTQISVGGLILFGIYQCYQVGVNSFEIRTYDILGNPLLATSTVTNGGAVVVFDTVLDSPFVTATLVGHGYQVGDTFPVLVTTNVGGIPLYGNYIIQTVPTADTFTFATNYLATSTATGGINGGNARYEIYAGVGPVPAGSGYGVGGYGTGGYGSGTGVAPTVNTITADDWTLDNWGEILIANPLGGGIFQWSPTAGNSVLTLIPNAPIVNQGIVVAMPQRQIIAWGSTFTGIPDPLLIRWCDVNNFNVWFGSVTNQAGSYRIPKGSKIVECIQGPQQTLIWTDLGLWAMQYIGFPDVYGFSEIGTGCGLIGRKAATSLGGAVYWMGQSQFYKLAGSGVEPIPCPIWDVVFQDLDTTNLDKIRVAPNSRFGEIAWYFPTKGNGGEPSHYIKYNVYLNQWDYGQLGRTAWINESVLGPPIGAGKLPGSAFNYIVQHETSKDAVDSDGNPVAIDASFQTGYFAISEADLKMFIDQIWPDMKWGYYAGTQNANVNLTFYVADYPGQTPLTYGPYIMTQNTTFLTPRFRGRLVSIKMDSNDIGTFWRIGNMRYRSQPDGKF